MSSNYVENLIEQSECSISDALIAMNTLCSVVPLINLQLMPADDRKAVLALVCACLAACSLDASGVLDVERGTP